MNRRIDFHLSIILGAFLIVHIFLYTRFGINSSNEAAKYIHQADLLLKGEFPSAPKYYYYLPITFLIAFVKKLSLGYWAVAFIQSLLSVVAMVFFYKGTKLVFGYKIAFISGLGLCLFVPFHSWDFYLYSESIFISLSLFLYYAVCRFEAQRPSGLLLIFTLLLLMIFTRPFGVLFIPPLFFYFLFSRYQNKKIKIATITCSLAFIAVMALIIDRIFHGGEDMDAMKPFIEEHIVCFVPQKPEGARLKLKYFDNGIRDIAYYIWNNPLHFLSLMLQRLYSFFKFSRPWYSVTHNIFLLSFIIPVYAFFLFGLKPALEKRRNITIYLLGLVILYPLATTFQCDDWHSRFTLLVLPPIFVFAAQGVLFLLQKLKRSQ